MKQNSFITLPLMLLLIATLSVISSCGDGSDNDEGEVTPTPTATVTPTPIPPSNPVCNYTRGADGPGGFLWKPKSDNTGTLVVLFPSSFTQKFTSVVVTKKKNKLEEKLVFSSFANGDRQHWRGKLPGGQYTGMVTATSPDTKVCQWKVKTPAQRVD